MLRGLLSFRRGYRPNCDDLDFVETVARRSRSFETYRRAHDHERPNEIIGGFFRQRSSPRFFAELDQIRMAAHRLRREHPSWVDATMRRVEARLRRALPIYGRTGPPLSGEFPWTSLEPGPGGDKLYRKRPHRFAFAPSLALADLYGFPAVPLSEVLAGWMAVASSRDNAVAYDSNLAVIERLLALSWTWAFLAAREAPSAEHLEQEALVLKVVRSDIEFLAPRLGISYANNHLLADGFAGWFIGCVWPELGGEDEMRGRFEPLWLRELSRQILADGTSFEHSTHYHEYACEMAAAYVILSRRNGHPVPSWALDRTRRMLEFQAVLAGPEGVPLVIGDATEDPLFPLDSGDGWGTAAWREIHRSLFGLLLAPAPKDAPSRERAFWLLGGDLAPETSELEGPRSLVSYPNGGFYVFSDAATGSRLVFRTGPTQGEAASPGHAHSDLLTVYWSVRGRPLTVDAGTYTYRARGSGWPAGEPDWRRYFTGSAAHNGLDIEGRDALGEVERSFRRGRIETFVSVGRVVDTPVACWVDGRVVGRGVYASHRRGVVLVPGEYYLVYDLLPENGDLNGASFGFQFSPEVEVERSEPRGLRLRAGDTIAYVKGSSGLVDPVCRTGSLDPVAGWVSPRYGERLPARQARFPVNPTTAVTAFLLSHAGALGNTEIAVRKLGETGLRITISAGDVEDTLLLNLGSTDTEIFDEGLRFRGELAWIRCRERVPSKLHWVRGARCDWPSRRMVVRSAEPSSRLEIDSGPDDPVVRFRDAEALSIEWLR